MVKEFTDPYLQEVHELYQKLRQSQAAADKEFIDNYLKDYNEPAPEFEERTICS